jgi:hypothetical protein
VAKLSKPVKLPSVGPTALGAEYAPFIYFDGVSTYGVNFGAIQIELAANIVVPDPTGPTGTRTDVMMTARIFAAAQMLRPISSSPSKGRWKCWPSLSSRNNRRRLNFIEGISDLF